MIQNRLAIELEKVALRFQRLWGWQTYAAAWLFGAVVALTARFMGFSFTVSSWPYANAMILATGVLLVYSIFHLRFLTADRYWVARQVEEKFPNLDSCLLAAIEQTPELPDGRFGFLQESVIRQALRHAASNDWSRVVSKQRMLLSMAASMATFGLFILCVGRTTPASDSLTGNTKKPLHKATATGEFSVSVEPGDTEVERGSSLLVLARVKGPLPADATLVTLPAGGETVRQEMAPSLDDPIFGGRVAVVTEPFEYRVELGGHFSPTYHVTVFEYPRLERADVRLTYPKYTGLEERLIQDIRTISVVEGTEVAILCQLNKSVKSARLIDNNTPGPGEKRNAEAAVASGKDGDKPAAANAESSLTLTARENHLYDVKFTAEKTRRFKLELIDEAGRHNTEKVLLVVQVVPNQPPTLKLVAPGRDLEVSPLEELDVKATAWDDYGVKRMGLSFGLAGQPTTDLVLGENAAARQKHELANLIRFEELQAQPDQLLAYHFWAEDFGPDGKLRRTSSDMYFAEVRHFDEIFRQGQQPPGGQQQQRQQQQQAGSQNAQAAQQLAQLQKDIINATWKLVRRETGAKPTPSFTEDVNQISQSQSEAIEQVETLGSTVTDPEAMNHLVTVMDAMTLAVKQLKAAHEQPAVAPLQPALAAEQSAYQALLKLRAREHEIVRQQQSSSSSSSQAARSQQQRQQLQQLDLTNEENRYETQRLAQAQPEKPEDRETKQVLNRLKELARRQHDLNERLKDLQSVLQEAQNEQKKEEIRQQLKRLQDEQRDVLRDTDELQSRMETPDNQERMAEERQQLEQARDQVRRASESLEKDKVTQAAASGTRAEKEFDELRNEFRRRASGRFNEEMREMRDAARALDQQEKKISEQLAETAQPDPAKKSLRDDNRSDEIAKGLNEQKERLSTLTERLKQTVEDAEQTEPLLSERLQDTARNLQDQKVQPALDATSRSLRQGLLEDARQVERIAGKGINQLREGIEKAAESVLGDETEALRRAREQLKNLAQELNQEIARNAPEELPQVAAGREPGTPNPNPMEKGSSSEGQNQSAQQKNPNQQPNGERQPGQAQAEQGQPGAPQSGRPQSPGQRGQQPGAGTPGRPQNGQPPNGEQQPPQSGSQDSPQGERPGRGQQPGARQPGQPQPGAGQSSAGQPGTRQPGERPAQGEEPENNGQQPGENPNGEPQQGQGQAGRQPMHPGQQRGQGQGQGQPQNGAPPQPGLQNQPGQRSQGGQQQGQRGGPRGPARAGNPTGAGGGIIDGTAESMTAPISGQDFMNWSDRLRDVEEMVDNPELRAEAARIREQARSIRAEMKRHSAEPNWKLVRVNVAEPLIELSNRVADELLRRNSKQAIVPLDRDPVPPKYSEKTRRYYEQLGNGK
ncbi:MAG: hypothetical protein JWM11_6902 [Planctomycetaceae bacterium]|nr:hypothetical protein [Planctomycetaceae bacterium]